MTKIDTEIVIVIDNLRLIEPEALFRVIDEATASRIILHWEAQRGDRSIRTERMYEQKTGQFMRACARQANCDGPSEISPIQVVSWLFQRSERLSEAAWISYRSALLHFTAKQRTDHLQRGLECDLHTIALAALIVVDQPPEFDSRPTAERPTARCNAISQERIETLCRWLLDHPSKFAEPAVTFAEVTRLTGMRPDEWKDVEVFPNSAVVDEDDREFALVINTSKRKMDEAPIIRTLWIATSEARSVVRQQLAHVRTLAEMDCCGRKRSPLDNYVRKVSACLGLASRILWPDDERVTLYTFRHQARADFVAAFGEPLAAAILGHGTDVSRKWYAPGRKGRKGVSLGIRPGDDVRARAAMLNQETSTERIARKPWARSDALDQIEAPQQTEIEPETYSSP